MYVVLKIQLCKPLISQTGLWEAGWQVKWEPVPLSLKSAEEVSPSTREGGFGALSALFAKVMVCFFFLCLFLVSKKKKKKKWVLDFFISKSSTTSPPPHKFVTLC